MFCNRNIKLQLKFFYRSICQRVTSYVPIMSLKSNDDRFSLTMNDITDISFNDILPCSFTDILIKLISHYYCLIFSILALIFLKLYFLYILSFRIHNKRDLIKKNVKILLRNHTVNVREFLNGTHQRVEAEVSVKVFV